MKKLICLLSIIGFLSACNNNDDSNTKTELVGNWKLIEVYTNTGGGGSFLSVDSNKTITFHNDGTITSNGSLCYLSIDTNTATSGTYSLSNSSFNSPDCDDPDHNFVFEQKGNILIISYPCIEPCQAKYKKV